MSPLTDDEKATYKGLLDEAWEIADSFEDEMHLPACLAVFEKIAPPLYFLRQAEKDKYQGPYTVEVVPASDTQKPSRIYGNEQTGWRDGSDKYDRPYQYAGERWVLEANHKEIMARLRQQKEAQPDAYVKEEHNGWEYWVNPSSKGWYLNRRRLP